MNLNDKKDYDNGNETVTDNVNIDDGATNDDAAGYNDDEAAGYADEDADYSDEAAGYADKNADYNDDDSDEEADGSGQAEGRKVPAWKISLEIFIYAVMFFICIYIVPNYVIQRTVVSGSSMLNTLHDGESLMVEKVSYMISSPDRFDIIVFYPYGRDDKDDYFVKRVIGLPGETVQIIGENILIDGQVLEEHYGKDPITDAGVAEKPITLGDNEFFVLGDNREISEDSRSFGAVDKKNIEGHVVFRIFPLNKFGPLTNK